jgi:hypothetical protein
MPDARRKRPSPTDPLATTSAIRNAIRQLHSSGHNLFLNALVWILLLLADAIVWIIIDEGSAGSRGG